MRARLTKIKASGRREGEICSHVPEENEVKPNPSIAGPTDPSASPSPARSDGADDSPSRERRRLLGRLPILGASCAAPRKSADASATTRTTRAPIESLLDRVVVRVLDTSGDLAARAPRAREARRPESERERRAAIVTNQEAES
jgi:hypothetical protein